MTKRLVNCWPLNLDALDILILSKVNNLLLNFVQLLVKETETLHYHRGLWRCVLAKLPRDDPEIDASILKHVQDPIEDLFVKQVTRELQRKALHTDAGLWFWIFKFFVNHTQVWYVLVA